jgi:hypothetical protein
MQDKPLDHDKAINRFLPKNFVECLHPLRSIARKALVDRATSRNRNARFLI